MKKYIAELIGTFILVFCCTGAVIANQEFPGQIGLVGISIISGLIVSAMIYALGDVSGAHINPAVSFAFYIAGEFSFKDLIAYLIAQAIGAFSASALLHYFFPLNAGLGGTLPSIGITQAFIMEIILMYILMLVIFQVAKGSKEKGMFAGIAIGSVVLLEILFAGPISGASMNPIRSLAPAIISGNTQHLWIYLTAPFLGCVLAFITWKYFRTNPSASSE